MSRSRKKNPAGGYAGVSEKRDKKLWHKRARVLAKTEKFVDRPVTANDAVNPWTMTKDGKQWWSKHGDKWMRK